MNILKKLHLKKNDNIYLNIDFMKLCLTLNVKSSSDIKKADTILKVIKKYVGSNGTIVIPIFNFDCVNNSYFDRKKTLGHTGVFANLLLTKYYKKRTFHPLYSFLVFGKLEKNFIKKKNFHANDENSLWKIFLDKRFKLITLGHHYNRAFTISHYLEKLSNINYRYDKSFDIKYIDGKKITKEKFFFYARKKNICKFSAITKECDNFFRKNNIFKYYRTKKLICFNLDLFKASTIILKDLKNKNCKYLNYISSKGKNSGKVLNMMNTSRLEQKYLII